MRDQQQQEGSVAADETASAGALRDWARVPKRARQAMKAAGPAILEELELPILSFLERVHLCNKVLWWPKCLLHRRVIIASCQLQETDTKLELEIKDSFRRLLVHGLASFHSLALRSNTATLTLRVGNSRPQQVGAFFADKVSVTPHMEIDCQHWAAGILPHHMHRRGGGAGGLQRWRGQPHAGPVGQQSGRAYI